MRPLNRRIEFLDHQLVVLPGAFPPAVETGFALDYLLGAFPERPGRTAIDVGTGVGTVALSLALRRPTWKILATDRSILALCSVLANRRRLGVDNVAVRYSNVLRGVPQSFRGRTDLIFSNVPFVHPDVERPRGIPKNAFTGPGDDGLDLMRRLFSEARDILHPSGRLVFQMGLDQLERFTPHVHRSGFEIELNYGAYVHIARHT